MGAPDPLPSPASRRLLANLARAEKTLAEAHRTVVDLRIAAGASFAEREIAYLDSANESSATNIRRDLEAIAASHGPRILVNGNPYKRHESGKADYHSLCGTVEISRPTYRPVGERNGTTIVPLDLGAGIIESATPALALAIAAGYAEGTDRQCEEQLRLAKREPPSRSTIMRIGIAVGMKAKGEAAKIETVLRPLELLPEGAHAIAIGLDRTSVPMEEPRPEGAPPVHRRKRTQPYKRKAPPRIDVNYRMAYVGTVAVVDTDGECMEARRYAASAEEGPDDILARMMADVKSLHQQGPNMPVGIVQDGAPEMWNLVRKGLAERVGIAPSHEAIDRYHFDERRAETLKILRERFGREAQPRDWNKHFDESDDAIDEFAAWFDGELMAIDKHGRSSDKSRDRLDEQRTFISNNQDRLRYAHVIAAGLPQGSGVTEGACKSLVTVRTKRSGQRWHDSGLGAVLALRSVKMSGRLSTFWPRFSLNYKAEVRSAANDPGPSPAKVKRAA